jgi:hypothetical protein
MADLELAWRYSVQRIKFDPVIAAAFNGGADPAWLEDIGNGIFRPEPRLKPAQVGPNLTAEQHVAECAVRALYRAEEWLALHCQRAEAFGMDAGRDVLSRALCLVVTLRERTAARGKVSASSGWLAAMLHDAVMDIAEAEAIGGGYAECQLDELNKSGLRTAINAVRDIATIAAEYRAGYLDDLTAVRGAAEASASVPTAGCDDA